MREIETTRFGTLVVGPDAVIRFPEALLGLDDRHDYCLLEHDGGDGFFWLQSLEDPAVALFVLDPFRHVPDYEVEIPDAAAELLEATAPSEVSLYTTVSLAPDASQVSTNLLGPLAINHARRVGAQVIQHGSRYQTRHVLARRAPVCSS